VIVTTGALSAGTYYVTATAIVTTSFPVYCYIAKGSDPQGQLSFSDDTGDQSVFQTAMTVAASVAAGDTLQELCYTPVSGQSAAAGYSGITAIRILSSSTGTTPAGSPAGH
jgi:hypothetical protein